MIADEGCAERGCPMHNSRETQGVVMVPKRPWVGLTDEEIRKLAKENIYVLNAIIATNAKLKDKNHVN